MNKVQSCPEENQTKISLPLARQCPFDPPPEYKSLRMEKPVCKVTTPQGDTAWLVTRHQDIREILTSKKFSSNPQTPGFPSYISGDIPPPPGFFLQADAPDHTRLRRIVTQDFLAKHVEDLKPRMQQIFDQALEDMLKQPQPVDLVKQLAEPVASKVICELLGVPIEDYPFVKSRTDTFLDQSRPAKETEFAAFELMSYFDKVITSKEAEPSSDLIGRLIANTQKEGLVNHQELVGLAALLLLGAYDTMALAMALGVVTLLDHPDQLADVLKDESLADNLVDELVRYLSINHAGLPRAVTEDVTIGNQLMKAGDGVLVMLSSGNRDENAFDNPDAFDIHRKEKNHLGFGHGLHKCLGIHFARAELQIAFLSLFRRVPTLRIAVPQEQLSFRHEMVLYGLHELPVEW